MEPGAIIGRCQIIRELGRGGVGTVYLARHQTLQIEVALKILSPALSHENPALAERFVREAQTAARIRHPNVIAVMDAAHDETTGLYFIVFEFVGGGSLSWHLRNGPLPEARALAIVTGIAHALAIAEENGIVHRDIKPDNIMLDTRGTAKLADLGLAKHSVDSRTTLTIGGSFMGTPAYMSPEQARDAKAADTRDDIYSLGATLYECLTGEPPFQGETPYNIMSELLTKPSPQPVAKRPEISDSINLICRKMMAKTRGLRYADAKTLLADLELCRTLGDAGRERLEAATFAHDSIMARQQALDYGVQTSADGVAVIPEPPENSKAPTTLLPPAVGRPRRRDLGVFATAALLVVLASVASLLFAWLVPQHAPGFIKNVLAEGVGERAEAIPAPTNGAPDEAAAPQPLPGDVPQSVTATSVPIDIPPRVDEGGMAPALTLSPAGAPAPTSAAASPAPAPAVAAETNAIPAVIPPLPVNGETNAAPAVAATPDSAFEARTIAESDLNNGVAKGHAPLLQAMGTREPGEVVPTTWTFSFYDATAPHNSRIVTVSDHRVMKKNDGFMRSLLDSFPGSNLLFGAKREADILPEEKLVIDSNQALQVAAGLVPGVTISSSQFILMQEKNSVPTWRVELWARDDNGGEKSLGFVKVLAEKGDPIFSTLKSQRVLKP